MHFTKSSSTLINVIKKSVLFWSHSFENLKYVAKILGLTNCTSSETVSSLSEPSSSSKIRHSLFLLSIIWQILRHSIIYWFSSYLELQILFHNKSHVVTYRFLTMLDDKWQNKTGKWDKTRETVPIPLLLIRKQWRTLSNNER